MSIFVYEEPHDALECLRSIYYLREGVHHIDVFLASRGPGSALASRGPGSAVPPKNPDIRPLIGK